MKLYRFLTGPEDATFCHKVTDALNKGWVLHGSPSLSQDANGNTVCGQAVIKEIEGKTYTPDIKLGQQ